MGWYMNFIGTNSPEFLVGECACALGRVQCEFLVTYMTVDGLHLPYKSRYLAAFNGSMNSFSVIIALIEGVRVFW